MAVLGKDIKKDDVVWVEFEMKIDHITSGDMKSAQLFGFTEEGLCVSAPISSVKDRLNRDGEEDLGR